MVIQNDLKTFFLIVIFLVKVGIVIRSSKEKLLPILKIFIYICRRLVQNNYFFMISFFLPLITLALPVLINSETTNLLNSGDTSLSGMFRGLLAVALGAALAGGASGAALAGGASGAALAGGALGAVSLGFFFFSGDFILLVEIVPVIDFSLSSRIDLFGICLLSMSTGDLTLGI